MEEIWKDIEGYKGLYQVSNLGRVKSIRNNIIKKPSKLPRGYLQICLCKNGNLKYISIHRLVAQAFIPNSKNLPCVNHKDCNPSNNIVSNLEWINHKDNNDYKGRKIKAKISSAIYYLKKEYPNEKEIINQLQKIREDMQNL